MRNTDLYDDSVDLIERVRKLREAAEKRMNAFGDPADYDVRIIRGHKVTNWSGPEAGERPDRGER